MDLVKSSLPTGTVMAYAGTTAPPGFLMCNGAALSRTQYAGLFAVLGTTFGAGDGSTTFNLPNTSGIFIRGAGTQTVDTTLYGGPLGGVQADAIQDHFHRANHGYDGTGSLRYGSDSGLAPVSQITTGGSVSSLGAPAGPPSAPTYAPTQLPRTAFETRPVHIFLNHIIKT